MMPRKKIADAKNTNVDVAPAPQRAARKPYPTHVERMAMADAKLESLTKLLEERKALLNKSEELVAQRREGVQRTEEMVKTQAEKRARIAELIERPAKPAGSRAKKAADRSAMAQLQEVLEASGKTVDDVIAMLKAN